MMTDVFSVTHGRGERRNQIVGAPDRIRTCGLRLRRPTLYPAELRALNLVPTPRDPNSKSQDLNGCGLCLGLGSWDLGLEIFRLARPAGLEPATYGFE